MAFQIEVILATHLNPATKFSRRIFKRFVYISRFQMLCRMGNRFVGVSEIETKIWFELFSFHFNQSGGLLGSGK